VVDASVLKNLALSLPGTSEAPHFDRTAFRVDRIFATLDASGTSVNLKFTPDEQEFKCQLAPDIFAPLDNAWGRQGWTTLLIPLASEQDVRAALQMAHAHAVGKSKRKR